MESGRIVKNSIVKCINGNFSEKKKAVIKNLPIKGKYYIIRDIEIIPESGKIAVRLEEIVNEILPPPSSDFKEPSFDIKRFELASIPSIIKDEFGDI